MGGKKAKRAVEGSGSKQELEQRISTLRRQLTSTEKALTKAKKRADRWRKEAKAQTRSASRATARVEKLRQRLDTGSAAQEPDRPVAPMNEVPSGRPTAGPTGGVTAPDETWSVVRLRAEARARGLTGMSNKTKPQLLAALS
jgi:hypothetical protein